MSSPSLVRSCALWALAIGVVFSFFGCQAVKKRFAKPTPEGVEQKSYPTTVFGYQSSVVVKATPEEIITRILKDFKWLEKASSALKVEITDLKPGTDLTEPGQSFGLNISALGIKMPCRVITIKYKPEKELWLLILTDATWVVFRINIDSIPEGSMLDIDITGEPKGPLSRVLDTFKIVELSSGFFDLLIASIQSEFDPELDINEVTQKGVRGEAYETFLQAYEAGVWIDASPEEVNKWIAAPENLTQWLHELQMEESFLAQFQQSAPGEMAYGPAPFKAGIFKLKTDLFAVKRKKGDELIINIYITAFGKFGFMEAVMKPDKGGCFVKLRTVIEIPTVGSANALNEMLFMGQFEKLMREKALLLKNGVENVG